MKQLEEKNKSLENMKQLIDSLNKQRDSNEDTIKSLKASSEQKSLPKANITPLFDP